MYASEEQSKWRKIAEISSYVLLFIVIVPGTTLGYFAETSLPNTPLYPMKTGIEKVILMLSSVNNSAKTAYELELARIRVQETQQLFTSNKPITPQNIQQLDIVATQLDNTRLAIDDVSDPVQKQQLQQQLDQTTQDYKNQLSNLKQHLNSSTSTTNRGAITPTITQITHDTNSLSNNSQSNFQDNTTNASDTSTSNADNLSSLDNLSSENQSLLQQTIDNVNDQLDTFTPSPTPPPDQTPIDIPIPTDTPIPTPTPTPYFIFNIFHNNNSHDGDHAYHDQNNQ